MQLIHTAITGKETKPGTPTTPYEALVEFYDAFNHGKLDLMEKNWANTPNIAMDNPLGGIMRGWANIRSVYQRIFEGQAKVYVEFYDYSVHETEQMFYAVGRERGFFETNNQRIDLAIRTSRIFEKTEQGWKQVHHHGSIENPSLLETYQTLVQK